MEEGMPHYIQRIFNKICINYTNLKGFVPVDTLPAKELLSRQLRFLLALISCGLQTTERNTWLMIQWNPSWHLEWRRMSKLQRFWVLSHSKMYIRSPLPFKCMVRPRSTSTATLVEQVLDRMEDATWDQAGKEIYLLYEDVHELVNYFSSR